MARPRLDHITDTQKQEQLKRNLSAMEPQLLGHSLSNFLNKKEKGGSNPFAADLKKEYRPVYDATTRLPPSSTLNKHLSDPEGPPPQTVACIAEFCSRAFVFDAPISADDLLTRDLSPFPPLRRTGQWKRYLGLYRCFYFNPDFPEEKDAQPQLHGGLLKLWEEDGGLQAFFVTGIRREEYFRDLEATIGSCTKEALHNKCRAYSDSYPDHEMRLVTYQGNVKTELKGYFLMQLQRHKHTNTALVLLRRWDDSAQLDYSGGIASVTLCRKSKIVSHAMIIVREKLPLTDDEAFLARYLKKADTGAKGMTVTAAMDETWNRAMMEHIREQAGR